MAKFLWRNWDKLWFSVSVGC